MEKRGAAKSSDAPREARAFRVASMVACIDYRCKVMAEAGTRVGLVAHVPNAEVTYLVRGQKVKKLLDHEHVITLDLSQLPEVRKSEEVTVVLPESNSPLNSNRATPVTLRDGASPGKGR
jgi:hypothetical protein